MSEPDLYVKKIVPFTIYQRVIKNGREYTVDIENITTEESRNISCEPVMVWKEPGTEYYYPAELPLKVNRGTGIKGFLCYLYDDLNEQEKKLFEDRTQEILFTRNEVTQVYPKKKSKKK